MRPNLYDSQRNLLLDDNEATNKWRNIVYGFVRRTLWAQTRIYVEISLEYLKNNKKANVADKSSKEEN